MNPEGNDENAPDPASATGDLPALPGLPALPAGLAARIKHDKCWAPIIAGQPLREAVQGADGRWRCANGHPICGAKSLHNPVHRCHTDRLRPNGRCRKHGGNNPSGIASPSFRTGRGSSMARYLPPGLVKHFDPDNPKLLDLRNEMALAESSIWEAVERIKRADQPGLDYKALKADVLRFKAARDRGDGKALAKAWDRLEAAVLAGATLQADRELVVALADHRARLVAVDSRRQKEQQEMVDRASFGRLAWAVLLAVANGTGALVAEAASIGPGDAAALRAVELKAREAIQADVLRLLDIGQRVVAEAG